MNLNQTVQMAPMQVPKTVRRDSKRLLTSGYAGKILPLAYVPLLREDRVSRGRMTFNFEMMETAEMLMNAVKVTVHAHFVPNLAFERFGGSMDRLNRSYAEQPDSEGGPVIPYFRVDAFERAWDITRTMGINMPEGRDMNVAPIEAYNEIVNMRRKAVSKYLPLRGPFEKTLAAAFWNHTNMGHIVPSFDQAAMDGEVELQLGTGSLPVTGIGKATSVFPNPNTPVREGFGSNPIYADSAVVDATVGSNSTFRIEEDPERPGWHNIRAELEGQGVKLSLANIEMAKQTVAFAKMRSQYKNVDDEFIIDLLMQGIRVPEEQMSQPILLGKQSTIFGYQRRFSTDADNLDKYVASGETQVTLNVRTPPMNTGGVIMYTCEIVPEQLFERQRDYYLTASRPDVLPNTQNDFLDPQKVKVVTNDHVDMDHTDPDGIFGYGPLNLEWQRNIPNVGGKYIRPEVDAAFDEDRQKLWANETPDPTLTEDFYLTNESHHTGLASQNQDPFEIIGSGEHEIVGNTVFGKGLQEATDDYETIMDAVDKTRLDPEEPTT